MNAKQGCWTIPQLMANLEARVAKLEATNKPVYVHHVYFEAPDITTITIDIVNATDEPFTNDTLTEHLLALPLNTRIMCTGTSSEDVAIISLTRQADQIVADLQDTDAIGFTRAYIHSDYVEPIRS